MTRLVSAISFLGANLFLHVLHGAWMDPAHANSNFGTVQIARSSEQAIEGYTAGSVPFFSILNAQEDSQNQPCVGYGERDPDHILLVSTALPTVTVAVDSDGGDTTLMIEGPDHTIYCGDDGNDADAVIDGRNWGEGEYRVWVGSFDPGHYYNYTLTIQP